MSTLTTCNNRTGFEHSIPIQSSHLMQWIPRSYCGDRYRVDDAGHVTSWPLRGMSGQRRECRVCAAPLKFEWILEILERQLPLHRPYSSTTMDFTTIKDQVSNLTLYDVKAGVRKLQNGMNPIYFFGPRHRHQLTVFRLAVMNFTEMEAKVRGVDPDGP